MPRSGMWSAFPSLDLRRSSGSARRFLRSSFWALTLLLVFLPLIALRVANLVRDKHRPMQLRRPRQWAKRTIARSPVTAMRFESPDQLGLYVDADFRIRCAFHEGDHMA